jgi:hypothetical protein
LFVVPVVCSSAFTRFGERFAAIASRRALAALNVLFDAWYAEWQPLLKLTAFQQNPSITFHEWMKTFREYFANTRDI